MPAEEKLRLFRPSLPLDSASAIIDACLRIRRDHGLLPLAVCVLDAGGSLVAAKREDGCGLMRVDIATGKASGALSMGMPSREMRDRFAARPTFQAAMVGIGNRTGKGWIAVPGGVLVLDMNGFIVAAVGVSGDASDKDEMVAVEAVKSLGFGLIPDPLHPPENWAKAKL
eukprot:NODE_19869_length_824_cov_4.969871.p1 GENE.NODE_19869_length_824_cov_4.969871~~NODE_19869_length_824_cov_4.969871.p1  ORF type:complete len:170 (-),score=37.56 NODE_19869_length_824_cov_4.969871:222-731(-)